MDGAMRARGATMAAALLLLGVLVFAAFALAGDEPPTPTISGEPRVGETLTASEAAVYKWQRCDPGSSECGSEGGHNGSGWEDISESQGPSAGAHLLTEADLAMMIRVLAKDTQLGTQFGASEPVGPVLPGDEEPPPPPPPPPPNQPNQPPGPTTTPPGPPPPPEQSRRPVFMQSGSLDPLEGAILAKLPGSQEWVEISELTEVPLGTKVDVSDGRVDLTTARRPAGTPQSVELWGGAFVVTQKRKARVTVLSLAKGIAGSASSGTGAQAAAKRRGRKLWGRGRCRCRHRGRNSSGTARGTWWLTVERPKGTVTKVRKGIVLVRDFKLGKKVPVRRGQRYLARR